MKKIALITGATSGIGEAVAIDLSRNGYNVIITGRRESRLDRLSKRIKSQSDSNVCCLCFDVRDREQVSNALESLPEAWRNIDVLVNNAGLASGFDNIQEGDIDDWELMIDTNIKGLLYVTRKIAPMMVARKSGYIINIGSTAGKQTYAKGNVYCATKYAVDALTKAMRIDMLPYGIKVTQIAPGMVQTEFSSVRFHGDEDKAGKVYEGLKPLSSEDISGIVMFLLNTPPHMCINDIVVTPTCQADAFYVVRGE